MRQAWFSQQHLKYKQLPDINTLIQEMKDLECFKQLHNTKTAKQTIRKVLTDWSNFKKALTAYSKDRSKFIRCPKPPHYKKKMAQVIFYNETIFGGQSKNKKLTSLTATNNCFSVPYREGYKQVVITPKAFGFVIEVQYESKKQKEAKASKDKVATIDIGVNTLAAITYGIDVTFTEEAYTSKASFYDRDDLPKYDEDEPELSGTRKHRGLYVSKDGFAVNADVNGSLNIGRKAIPEFYGIGDRSLAARPVVINPLNSNLDFYGFLGTVKDAANAHRWQPCGYNSLNHEAVAGCRYLSSSYSNWTVSPTMRCSTLPLRRSSAACWVQWLEGDFILGRDVGELIPLHIVGQVVFHNESFPGPVGNALPGRD